MFKKILFLFAVTLSLVSSRSVPSRDMPPPECYPCCGNPPQQCDK